MFLEKQYWHLCAERFPFPKNRQFLYSALSSSWCDISRDYLPACLSLVSAQRRTKVHDDKLSCVVGSFAGRYTVYKTSIWKPRLSYRIWVIRHSL